MTDQIPKLTEDDPCSAGLMILTAQYGWAEHHLAEFTDEHPEFVLKAEATRKRDRLLEALRGAVGKLEEECGREGLTVDEVKYILRDPLHIGEVLPE